MPAVYGPGCPSKYQSQRNRTWKGQAYKRQRACADVSIAACSPDGSVDAKDVLELDTVVPEWPARIGPNPAQSNNAVRPDNDTDGWGPDGGPALYFDDVGEALDWALDFTSSEQATIMASYYVPLASNFNVVGELGRYYIDNGFSLFLGDSVRAFPDPAIVGLGDGPANYNDPLFQGYGSGRYTATALCDTALPQASEAQLYIGHELLVTDDQGAGTGATGNLSGSTLQIGARDNGAGGYERGLGGWIRQMVVWIGTPTDSERNTCINALQWKARHYD